MGGRGQSRFGAARAGIVRLRRGFGAGPRARQPGQDRKRFAAIRDAGFPALLCRLLEARERLDSGEADLLEVEIHQSPANLGVD